MPARTQPARLPSRPASQSQSQPLPRASGEGAASGQIKSSGQVTKEAPIERKALPPRETDGHRVDVELGTTENLGDMNFAKCFVRVTIPCTATTLREAGNEAYEQADAMLEDFNERFVRGSK